MMLGAGYWILDARCWVAVMNHFASDQDLFSANAARE
jgi:hypothetical protein